ACAENSSSQLRISPAYWHEVVGPHALHDHVSEGATVLSMDAMRGLGTDGAALPRLQHIGIPGCSRLNNRGSLHADHVVGYLRAVVPRNTIPSNQRNYGDADIRSLGNYLALATTNSLDMRSFKVPPLVSLDSGSTTSRP